MSQTSPEISKKTNMYTQTNIEEAFANLKNSVNKNPQLVEPIKILHAQKLDSFWDVHYDFVCVVCIFLLIIIALYHFLYSDKNENVSEEKNV